MQNSRYGEPTVFSTSQRVGTPNSHIVQGSNEFVHCFSVIQLCLSFCDPMNCSTPVFPVLHYLQSLLKFMSNESVMPSNHLILCCPLLILPSVFPSIRVFSLEKEMATHSSVLAWGIPGMAEPVELPPRGSHRVRHDWSDLAEAAAEAEPEIRESDSSRSISLSQDCSGYFGSFRFPNCKTFVLKMWKMPLIMDWGFIESVDCFG